MKNEKVKNLLLAILCFGLAIGSLALLVFIIKENPNTLVIIIFGIMTIYFIALGIPYLIKSKKK